MPLPRADDLNALQVPRDSKCVYSSNPPALVHHTFEQYVGHLSLTSLMTRITVQPSALATVPSMYAIPIEHETHVRFQSSQSLVVYECKAAVPCGLYLEGTHGAISAHLRRHGITASPDHNTIDCPWDGCSKTIKKDSLTRHILTHIGVKARCSMCGLVRSRCDVIRAHIASSESCKFAFSDVVHGPEGHAIVGTISTAAYHV